MFICLMLGGAFLGFNDYQTYSNPTPSKPDLIPTRMMLGSAPLDPEITARMDEVFEQTELTIQTANTSGKLMARCSYWLGWIGSFCSWVILGITTLMKNKLPDSKGGESNTAANSKMPSKTIATGVLAVVAAVCPVAISKCDLDSALKYEHANTLRDDKSSVRTEVMSGLAKDKSLALLDKLMDKAGR